jgi:hypothetical protein
MHLLGRRRIGQHYSKVRTFQTWQPSSLRGPIRFSTYPHETKHKSSSKYGPSATPPTKNPTLANSSLFVLFLGGIVWYSTLDSLKYKDREPHPFAALSKGLNAKEETSLHTTVPFRSLPDRKFNYKPLSPGQKTRLLILQPGNFEDELQCRLEHVEVLEDWDYVALSYFWGPPSSHTISCSGGTIPITHNLDAALRQLRLK